MKNVRILFYGLIPAVFLFVFSVPSSLVAQENEADNFKMLFNFNTIKKADQSRVLTVEFLARNKENRKDKIAVTAAPIEFYNVLEDEELLLGKANTNKKGVASLVLSPEQYYLTDAEGYITLLAIFEGTEAVDEQEEELMIKDLKLTLDLDIEDSTKMAYVTAYTLDSLGEEVPVEELDIIVGVKSMISAMPIAEDYLEEGEFEVEVPEGIPGDQNGELVVQVMVDESDEFGTVYAEKAAAWGKRGEKLVAPKHQLWTKAAPIWMYVVLTIMLVGVWANYAYTVVNLRKIKKMGKNNE